MYEQRLRVRDLVAEGCSAADCRRRRLHGQPQIAMLVEMLSSAPPLPQTMDIHERRNHMEELTRSAPIPEGARFAPVEAGGVPCEWVEAPGATADALYLHSVSVSET